jgi:hypothetical protein
MTGIKLAFLYMLWQMIISVRQELTPKKGWQPTAGFLLLLIVEILLFINAAYTAHQFFPASRS